MPDEEGVLVVDELLEQYIPALDRARNSVCLPEAVHGAKEYLRPVDGQNAIVISPVKRVERCCDRMVVVVRVGQESDEVRSTPGCEKAYKRRVLKFWKNTVEFTGSTWVCGDYLVMIITNQHPHYLIEIHDATLAHNVREICKGIWKDVQ